MEIKNTLEQLGFSKKEAEVYLAVLTLGKSTPSKIAKVTKLNRPTVYSVAKTLISKGVISEDLADKSFHLVALPPESLKASIEKSKSELKKKEEIVDAAVESLRVLTAEKNFSVPKIRFVEQGGISDFLYHNIARWQRSITDPDGAMYGFQDHSFVEQYQEWVEWAGDKFKATNFKVRLFSNVSQIEQKMKGKLGMRDIRFLPTSQFTSTTWVVGDYLIMVYTRKAPFYMVEIHDAAMAENMREVFKTMWGMTQPSKAK
ncbi:MAG: transcriptional regulator TrmB [Candidatus Taylorbacteria bacterium]|nr:transcriptional regulator TrmB [Candidatus Taylorbacteria bacterium]